MKKIGLLVVLVLGLAALAGCHGGGGYSVHSDPYLQPWYDVYGYHCGSGTPQAGCNFYSNGDKIIDAEDPYYGPSNMIKFGTYLYTDSYGYDRTYTGWGWLSSTGILYDDYGSALNEEEGSGSRDLVETAALQEQATVEGAGNRFAETYALSSDAGVRIARTLNDWATLGKKRSRTSADIADFSQRLFGISVEKASGALDAAKLGNSEKLEAVNADVANFWGTSPETAKSILKGWYKDQLSEISAAK